MDIIMRSKSIILTAAATSSPALPPIKYNNTKILSQAKSRSTASRSVSPYPINLKHNKEKNKTCRKKNTRHIKVIFFCTKR
jgi:hypothetical protein